MTATLRFMRLTLGLLIAAALAAQSPVLQARGDVPRSPRNASYTLTATLDPINHLILGTGRLVWRNTSRTAATDLRFHLYWNAWRDDTTTWMRERALMSGPSFAKRPDEDRGFIDLTSLSVDGPGTPASLLGRAHFVAPDDGNAADHTVLAVPLDTPVAPGETVTVDLGWNAHVPRPYSSAGVIGRTFFLAQWFPAIGVLEDAGWNCHQFHAATTSFADFGNYDVSVTVPSGWVVGATGVETSTSAAGAGMTSHRFVENDITDFAWTTSPDYVDLHQRFEEPGLPPIDVRLLLQSDHSDEIDRHFRAADAALADYDRWFGPYPYSHLTIVDPVSIADAGIQGETTGHAAYPTLITAGTQWIDPWRGDAPEGPVVEETARAFLAGAVAPDVVEHAWMDDGLARYAAAHAVADAFPDRFATVDRYFGGLVPWTYRDVAWSAFFDGGGFAAFRAAAGWNTPSAPGWKDWPGAAIATNRAGAALWLTSLERIIGWDAMQRVLAAYYAKNVFAHPGPDDFFRTVNAVTGEDYSWFVDAVYRSGATFDYAVDRVVSSRTESGAVDSRVVVRRLGAGVFPVDVRVTFDDGASVVERWNGQDAWRELRYRRGSPVATVEIDPDRVLTLDIDEANNSWTSRPHASGAARKWALEWLDWFEHTLLTYAFFA